MIPEISPQAGSSPQAEGSGTAFTPGELSDAHILAQNGAKTPIPASWATGAGGTRLMFHVSGGTPC